MGRVEWWVTWSRNVELWGKGSQACAYGVDGLCKIFFFNYHLPSSKIICLTKILNLNGFDVREYGKDTLLIFYLTKEQTTKYCKKTSCLSSQTHVYTTQFRNTWEDPCRLNGWQPTETCIKNMENSRKHILKFPTQLKEMKMKPSLKQNSFFPQISAVL